MNHSTDEREIEHFWNTHPCGDDMVGRLHGAFDADYEQFFAAYDAWRYRQERHIPACLDQVDWQGQQVLEIGLGQGAESEQLIRRGARWSGLDLTREAVDRVRTRVVVRELPYESIKQGSALAIPWADNTFDLVFSHGVLHHIPDIRCAQDEIARVLKPNGMLIAMLYARNSLNYQFSIKLLRRASLAVAYPLRRTRLLPASTILREHLENAESVGLPQYLAMDRFIHRNTDGPHNPYTRVYTRRDAIREFRNFELVKSYVRYMHAPPLPANRVPGQQWLGWHLWLHLRVSSSGPQAPTVESTSSGTAT